MMEEFIEAAALEAGVKNVDYVMGDVIIHTDGTMTNATAAIISRAGVIEQEEAFKAKVEEFVYRDYSEKQQAQDMMWANSKYIDAVKQAEIDKRIDWTYQVISDFKTGKTPMRLGEFLLL